MTRRMGFLINLRMRKLVCWITLNDMKLLITLFVILLYNMLYTRLVFAADRGNSLKHHKSSVHGPFHNLHSGLAELTTFLKTSIFHTHGLFFLWFFSRLP